MSESDDVGQARIVCPDCGTEQTVPLDEWEAIVDRHNEQRHGGAVAADLEEAILPEREIRTDGGTKRDVFRGVAPDGGCEHCGRNQCCNCSIMDTTPEGMISKRTHLGGHYACEGCYSYAMQADGGTEMVDVVSRGGGGSQRNSVHTDSNCHRLQFASNSVKKPREDVDDGRICSFCSGEHEAHQPEHNPNETRQKLLDMDPEDLGLSPMADRGDEGVADAE